MSFTSYEFVALLCVTVALFVSAPASARLWIILIASYVFYAYWSLPFLALLLFTTTTDYLASVLIKNATSQVKKKSILFTAISLNVIILGFFKYYNFLTEAGLSLASLLHLPLVRMPHLDILLPLGISYFTFEAISYTVDVYRGKEPARNWLHYNFYIMYFPHLVAGPIVRFEDLAKQYAEPISRPSPERIGKAFELIILGYLFKSLIADPMGVATAPTFDDPRNFNSLQCLTTSLEYCCCLYFDFLAYTHIARGISYLFNLELPINFNHPLIATNIANFWQRWQISLSRWLHDYIYQPLGGRTKNVGKRMLVAFTTLLIAGIWHGAGWNFVALGLFYGSAVAAYHGYRAVRKKIFGEGEKAIATSAIYNLASIALTFMIINVSVILFRENNIHYAFQIIEKMFRFSSLAKELKLTWRAGDYAVALTPLLCIFLLQSGTLWEKLYYRTLYNFPYWLKLQIGTVALLFCWVLNTESAKSFIYFRF